jgi:multidrug efflux pump subunit AcrA (membrane-fusion protein)
MAEEISLEARVVAAVRELRFSFGGVVESFSAEVGKIVAAGEAIGRLRREELTKKRQLKLEAYNKIRATFEQVKKKLEGNDDPDKKYLMDRAQADLNSSVLEVELAQLEFDGATLTCPFDGLVMDDGGIAPGMAISPASFSVKIADLSSIKIQAEVAQEKMNLIKKDQYAEFTPLSLPETVYKGRIFGFTPEPLDKKSNNFGVWCALENKENLLPGMTGSLKIFFDR